MARLLLQPIIVGGTTQLLEAGAAPSTTQLLAAGAITIGRGFCGILDLRLSRQHCRLTPVPGGVAVDALGANGVEVVQNDGTAVTLMPGQPHPHILEPGDELRLLPGKHRFRLKMDDEPVAKKHRSGDNDEAAAASPSLPSAPMEHWQPLSVERSSLSVPSAPPSAPAGPSAPVLPAGAADGAAHTGAAGAADAGAADDGAADDGAADDGAADDGAAGAAGATAEAASGAAAGAIAADDWTSLALPPFAQPPKPSYPAGLDALQRVALDPEAQPRQNLFLLTADFVVAYDLYPKARVHLLILPRGVRIDEPAALTSAHVGMLRAMDRLATFLATELRRTTPGQLGLDRGRTQCLVPDLLWQLNAWIAIVALGRPAALHTWLPCRALHAPTPSACPLG